VARPPISGHVHALTLPQRDAGNRLCDRREGSSVVHEAADTSR